MSDTPETPIYKLGDVVNGHQLIAHDDGRMEWVPLPAATATVPPTAATTAPPTTEANVTGTGTPAKKSRRTLWITLGSVAAVLLLIGFIGNLNRPAGSDRDPVSDTSPSQEATPEPEVEMVAVPTGLVGMIASDAEAALVAVGLRASYDGEPTAKVLSISPTAAEVEAGSTVTLTVEQPPALTLPQRNAIGSAESYLAYTNFSRSGLIHQLEFEGYSNEDATFAVDYVNPDWNVQAAGSAESYLAYTSFSRQGLYDQLIYEGFTPDQANAGLAAVGY